MTKQPSRILSVLGNQSTNEGENRSCYVGDDPSRAKRAEAATGRGSKRPTAQTWLSIPQTARNISFCTLPMIKGGNGAIRRYDRPDDDQYFELLSNASWYTKEEHRLLSFGDFGKHVDLWRHHYIIKPAINGTGPLRLLLRRDGMWHPDNRGSTTVRHALLDVNTKKWPNADLERRCELAIVAASSPPIQNSSSKSSSILPLLLKDIG